MNLQSLFNPRSVAVIGASADQSKVGYVLLDHLLLGAKRQIYPINPTSAKIAGLTCYKSVLEIKAQVDLAIIAVPAVVVDKVLVECGRKKIKFVIIISSGFKETGPAGKQLEQALKTTAAKYDIELLGPNCMGLIDAQSKLNASFASVTPRPGQIAFVSQSGAIGSSVLDWAKHKNIGFSKFVSLGNEAGLTENDFLEYLARDKNTKAICLYLEAVSNGRQFFELIKKITPHKPVVILKAGRSTRGQQAVASHTGSLAPADNVFQAACRQAGATVIPDLRDLFNIIRLFNAGIYQPLKKLAILTNGGGPSIVLVDLIEASVGLDLAELSAGTKARLRAVLPAMAIVDNPVDIIGDARADRYLSALKILVGDKSLDAVAVILTPQKITEVTKTAEAIVKYQRRKPLLPIFIGEASVLQAERIFRQKKIASFAYVSNLVEALEALNFKPKTEVPKKLIKNIQVEQQMPLDETLQLLKKYQIAPVGQVVNKIGDLPQALKQAKWPLAMKVISAEVIHKTDWGGVKLNLKSLSEAQTAWSAIVKNIKAKTPRAKIDGMWLQPMLTGREVLIGAKRDPNFGPVIVFGLGGIFVETLKDVALRIAPLNAAEAAAMILDIKGYKILQGTRGEEAVNFKAVAKILMAVSKLMMENEDIQAIDLNPVILNGSEASIIDARIII